MPGTSCTLGVSRAKSRQSLPLSGRVAIAVWLTVVLAKTLEVSTIGVSAVTVRASVTVAKGNVRSMTGAEPTVTMTPSRVSVTKSASSALMV